MLKNSASRFGQKQNQQAQHHIFKSALIILWFLLMQSPAVAFEHPGGLHTGQLLETVRNNVAESQEPWATAYQALIVQADENLARTPDPVEDFNVPGYYDDPDGHREAMDRLSLDGWTAYCCAIAYQTSQGDARIPYADKALEVLNAWATTNKKASNFDGDLAMTDAGVGLVLAAELMSDYEGWEAAHVDTFKQWLNQVYLLSCNKIVNEINNWGDWAILGRIASHYFLDAENELDENIELIKEKINKEIAADGHMPLETARDRRGMWYTYFALAPLTAACQIGENARDVNLFRYKGSDGAGVEQALDYFFKYCLNPDDWPHYSGDDLNRPKTTRWPANLYEAMSTICSKGEYADWAGVSRPIMEYGHHYAWAAPTLLRDESFTVTGRVMQESGETAVAHMKMELYDDEWRLLADQYTDEEGNYEFGCILSDAYYVSATGLVGNDDSLKIMFQKKYSGNVSSRDEAELLNISGNIADVDFSMPFAAAVEHYGTNQRPEVFELQQNYPNPFNPTTRITLAAPVTMELSLNVVNMRGEHVKQIIHNKVVPAGSNEFVWDGTDEAGVLAPSGVYFYTASAENLTASRKMILLR